MIKIIKTYYFISISTDFPKGSSNTKILQYYLTSNILTQ